MEGYALSFDKISRDGSGKATLIKSAGEVVHGRLFDVASGESGNLDSAEGALGKNPGYLRDDKFDVLVGTGTKTATTYLGRNLEKPGSLKPYDWYLALVVAGAVQGGLPDEYISDLRDVAYITESPPTLSQSERERVAIKKQEASDALVLAGFKSIVDVLKKAK